MLDFTLLHRLQSKFDQILSKYCQFSSVLYCESLSLWILVECLCLTIAKSISTDNTLIPSFVKICKSSNWYITVLIFHLNM
ncbi:hypothetical protein GDO86_005422 [Hymenochirus boettgeri]|uniref:Uncharacterized protein n=1 Tax=Hymenochirus boettgeri TaxID=247094 RepID=A0A8T2J9S7_9PIPI|nr:hypothetical protein GDO86_005422 [Hymenochirus boettgeri]